MIDSQTVEIDLTNYPFDDTNIYPFYNNQSSVETISSPWTIAGWFSVLDTTSGTGFNGGYIAYFGLLTTGPAATTNRIAIYLDRIVPTNSDPIIYYLVLVYGKGNGTMLDGGWTKRIPIDFTYDTWFFYAATFDNSKLVPEMDDFKLYVGKCDDASLDDQSENNTTAGKPDSSNPYSSILYSTSGSATDKNFGQSLYKLVLGAPAGESPSMPGYYSDFYIWNSELSSSQLNYVFNGGPKNIFDIQTVPPPMDWFNWQNNLSNNISNRPDFGFTQTDTLSLNTTYNHFVSWDFAQPGKPCGGMSPGPRPPRPPTEPPTTTTNIGCDESAASPQQEGMWNYNSKHSRGNLFIPRSCMSDLGESLITKVGFELYIPKEIQQSINFVGDWPSSKEWKVEGVDMWIFMHTTADKYPTLFNGLNILVTGVIDDYNKPIPSTTEKAYMDGIKNHTQVLNNGILSFTQADVLDGLLVQQPTGLSDPETRGYYKKYVYLIWKFRMPTTDCLH